MRRSSLTALAVAAALLGCREPSTVAPVLILPDAKPTVTVDGATLVLETYIWRDFQPISPPDGKPLIAVLRVKTADGSPVPRTVTADRAWVILGSDIWETAVVEEQSRTAGASYFEVVARNGPKWGPDVTVDVAVRLRGASGDIVLLGASDQPIHRTD